MPVSGGVVLREYEITDGTATTSGTGDHVYGLGRRLATRLPNSGSDTVNLYVNDWSVWRRNTATDRLSSAEN
jgi:hypothetical protein